MSATDLLIDDGLLPYPICTKIVLENNPDDVSETNVTLYLELLQNKTTLNKSSWLSEIASGKNSLTEYIFLQIVPITNRNEVSEALRASNQSFLITNDPNNPGTDLMQPNAQVPPANNVWTAQREIGDGKYLPRGVQRLSSGEGPISVPHVPTILFDKNQAHGDFSISAMVRTIGGIARIAQIDEEGAVTPGTAASALALPPPINIAVGSDLTGQDRALALPNLASKGKIRSVVKHGVPYYIIPITYTFTYNEDYENLGFVFYTFLDVPSFIKREIGSWNDEYNSSYEEYVIESGVNVERIILGNETLKTREIFTLPSGQIWEGPVHHHGPENPTPEGYQSEGTLLTDAANRVIGPASGWMVGGKHHGPNQPKLALSQVPNSKIVDFRSSRKEYKSIYDNVLGQGEESQLKALGAGTVSHTVTRYQQSGRVADRVYTVNVMDDFLSPFQKETRKYIDKAGAGDNDSEYSKLYMTQDAAGAAIGLFMINFESLLNNNSQIYSTLNDNKSNPLPFHLKNYFVRDVLLKSKILELKVYRDRVKKRSIGVRYENYSNDESYEEPSRLIGTLKDEEGWKSAMTSPGLREVDLLPVDYAFPGMKGGGPYRASTAYRYFLITDSKIRDIDAGLYRYRVELDFQDGAYSDLYNSLNQLSTYKTMLQKYYDMSLSNYYFSETVSTHTHVGGTVRPSAYKKGNLTSYFNSTTQAYEMPSFLKRTFDEGWWRTGWANIVNGQVSHADPSSFTNAFEPAGLVGILSHIQKLFGLSRELDFRDPSILIMLDPIHGSPQGIQFFIKLVTAVITKLENLLGTTKVKKTGSELDNSTVASDQYNFTNMFDYVISPSKTTIHETHTFDHPSELFRAAGSHSNEKLYMDYLYKPGVVFQESSLFGNMKALSPAEYRDRCRYDAAKFSGRAATLDGFYGIEPGSNMFKGANGSQQPENSLSHTAFSYLAPSYIRLSMGNSLHIYRAFASQGTFRSPLNPRAKNLQTYDDLMAVLICYKQGKKTVSEDMDILQLGTPRVSPGDEPTPEDLNAATRANATLSKREPYKQMFSELGVTVHLKDSYDKFFDRGPGSVSAGQTFNANDLVNQRALHTTLETFSDGDMASHLFYKRLISNPRQNMINLPVGVAVPSVAGLSAQMKELPNGLKLWYSIKNLGQQKAASPSSLDMRPIFLEALAQYPKPGIETPSIKYNAFSYFNFNLTAKVEVFTGVDIGDDPGGPNPMKNDDDAWRTLVESDLNVISNSDTANLLCRTVLYREELAYGLEIPMINKYFLIGPGAPGAMESGPGFTASDNLAISDEMVPASAWTEAGTRAPAQTQGQTQTQGQAPAQQSGMGGPGTGQGGGGPGGAGQSGGRDGNYNY